MIVLISSAKTMCRNAPLKLPCRSIPIFRNEAHDLAGHMLQYTSVELAQILNISQKLANENYYRFQHFFSDDQHPIPAILAYTGIVYKNISPHDFSEDEFEFAQQTLRIASFMYGILAPFDLIKPYRMESNVDLAELGHTNLYHYWRTKFTEALLADLENTGNILINLASASKFKLFTKNKVTNNIRIITPEFKVRKNLKINTPVVYIKMARGQMVRYIIKNKINDPEILKSFKWEGFEYNEEFSGKDKWVFFNG